MALIGNERETNTGFSQVYQATHDGAGKYLPYQLRSFISFTYGGKPIEDFGLIAVTDGDRLERNIYSEFTDVITENEVIDGQLYWGTRLSANKIELTLATDGMTEQQLDNFREWFSPGVTRELILAEHPNRAILARVSEQPKYSFLPFQQLTSMKIANNTISVNTTLYKGQITLMFVMDNPYWYAKLNYMPTYVNRLTLAELAESSNNTNKVTTLEDQDMLKIMLEDGIPHQSILAEDGIATFFLGGNHLVTELALVGVATVGNSHIGIITGESHGLSFDGPNTTYYLFYSGTAKSYPKIQFSMPAQFGFQHPNSSITNAADNEKIDTYITRPLNKFWSPNITNYSYIRINNSYFYFTTPSILTGYNQAMYLFRNLSNSTSLETLKMRLSSDIHEYYVRAWAIGCVNELQKQDTSITTIYSVDRKKILQVALRKFIDDTEPFKFSFDSKTGEALGTFQIRTFASSTTTSENATSISITENVGDMIRSNFLVIEGRDYLNSSGKITANNCHIIRTVEQLDDVLIFYQNMYL